MSQPRWPTPALCAARVFGIQCGLRTPRPRGLAASPFPMAVSRRNTCAGRVREASTKASNPSSPPLIDGSVARRAPEGAPQRRQLIVAPITASSSKAFAGVAEDARALGLLLHQDALYPGGEAYEQVVCVLTYLVKCPIDRACLWVVPESHRGGLLPHETGGVHDGGIPTHVCDFDRAGALPGEAGDAVFWDFHLVHGSKQNVTSEPRRRGSSRERRASSPRCTRLSSGKKSSTRS